MPFEKIGEVCTHREHTVPQHIKLDPGVYRYTCPGCGRATEVRVNGAMWSTRPAA